MELAKTLGGVSEKFGGVGAVLLAHIVLGFLILNGLKTISRPPHNDIGKVTYVAPQKEKIRETTPVNHEFTFTKNPIVPEIIPNVIVPPSIDSIHDPVSSTSERVSPPCTEDCSGPKLASEGPATKGIPIHKPAILNLEACKPEYPRISIIGGETGVTTVQFVIGQNGRVLNARIVNSSGFKNLDRAALNGLSSCQFSPATQDGNPVESSFTTEYSWHLND